MYILLFYIAQLTLTHFYDAEEWVRFAPSRVVDVAEACELKFLPVDHPVAFLIAFPYECLLKGSNGAIQLGESSILLHDGSFNTSHIIDRN